MARIHLYRSERDSVGRRQLPIASSNLMMLMDLSSKGLPIDSPPIRGRELEEFTRKFNLLTADERRKSLTIESETFLSVLNQCVQCVGCRRRVELLFQQLSSTGHPTLDPLVFNKCSSLTLSTEKLQSAHALGTVLYRHHEILNNVLENKLRNKTRCVMHSMEAFRAKPFSETWREVWSSMKYNCRDEITIIEMKELHECLETYLKKHKFCQGCREKIEKAYKILVGELTCKDKGFVPALYANIKKCQEDKHLHIVTTKTDFLDALIRRAEPEVSGSTFAKHRERHAKTLEIAQEEVLTCVGMIIYDRLRRVYISLREGERACQVLAAVGIHSLCRSFDTAVEKKQGISNLEVLYQEISRAERAKELKKELKKLKKKQKKNEKKERKNSQRCNSTLTIEADEEPDEAVDVSGDHDLDVDDDVDVEDAIVVSANAAIRGDIDADAELATPTETSATVTPTAETPPTLSKKQKRKQKSVQKHLCKKKNNHNELLTEMKKPNGMLPVSLSAIQMADKCQECLEPTRDCPCDVKDCGYSSEPNSRTSSAVSSPDGSEVSCSDGFCNHEQGNAHDLDDEQTLPLQQYENEHLLCDTRFTLSLQKMLDELEESEDDESNCYIPPEVVLAYESHHEKVQQERLKLRQTLRQNFERLCLQKGISPSKL